MASEKKKKQTWPFCSQIITLDADFSCMKMTEMALKILVALWNDTCSNNHGKNLLCKSERVKEFILHCKMGLLSVE